jgi:hypothetical protein
MLDLAGPESEVARRVFAAAADALDELADGFETALDEESRLRMLRRAWHLAPPASASLLLVEEHLAEAGDARERRPKTEADYARQLREALREPVAQPELFTAYMQRRKRRKSWTRGARGPSDSSSSSCSRSLSANVLITCPARAARIIPAGELQHRRAGLYAELSTEAGIRPQADGELHLGA